MSDDLQTAVAIEFRRIIAGLDGVALNFDADMVARYGPTSLNKVVFLSSARGGADVSRATFTDQDLSQLRTLGDVATVLLTPLGTAGPTAVGVTA